MSQSPMILIKIGGRPAGDPRILRQLIHGIARYRDGYRVVLIHGGGAEVSRISRAFEIEPEFIDGIRQTREEEMAIIDMGLAGRMNAEILRMALAEDLPAVGISGIDAGLFTGEAIAPGNRTGKVTEVRRNLIDDLLAGGYLPVVSPVSSDVHGGGLNINADDAAMALAEALLPRTAVFLSDIPGVLDGPPDAEGSALIPELNSERAHELIGASVISGGMIPKVRNALTLIKAGVREVIIGSLESDGLDQLIEGNRGTRFRH